jgi:type II secretion system protein G
MRTKFFEETQPKDQQESGFTLIELLVVIFIIGILAAVILANIAGIRNRAKDTRRKGELQSLKEALRLFYNDYQMYPEETDDHKIHDDYIDDNSFVNDSSGIVYMKELPEAYRYNVDDDPASITYFDAFRLRIDLENISDTAISESQNKCPAEGPFANLSYYETTYVLCED